MLQNLKSLHKYGSSVNREEIQKWVYDLKELSSTGKGLTSRLCSSAAMWVAFVVFLMIDRAMAHVGMQLFIPIDICGRKSC